jgi:hypothetical protein
MSRAGVQVMPAAPLTLRLNDAKLFMREDTFANKLFHTKRGPFFRVVPVPLFCFEGTENESLCRVCRALKCQIADCLSVLTPAAGKMYFRRRSHKYSRFEKRSEE